jgi:hypothetical protein
MTRSVERRILHDLVRRATGDEPAGARRWAPG